jgi:hypothetical protein
MKKNQPKQPSNKAEKVAEPLVERNKGIVFFSSFEESENYSRQQMAELSHEKRLFNLEALRRQTLLIHEQKIKSKKTEKIFKIIKAQYL